LLGSGRASSSFQPTEGAASLRRTLTVNDAHPSSFLN
jgi:hypothetical protein